MDCNYDEAVVDNVFYRTLLQDYRDLFIKCVSEDCILCVPRAGSVSKGMLTFETFCAHIIVPSYELPESHFVNINGEEVRICDRIITVEHEVGHQSSVHILFEETFYTSDGLKYKILCIEKPIENKGGGPDNVNRIITLRTLRECIDFLWMESGTSATIEKINQLTADFLKLNHDFEKCNLQMIIDTTNALYVKCVQSVLKCTKIRQRLEADKSLLTNIKIAVETCMQQNIYNKVIKGISMDTAAEDAQLNKIIRNLSGLQIQDFDVRPSLYDAIPNAKYELSKIDSYSTILGKTGCLKKMVSALSNYSEDKKFVSADDILQILIFLIIKIGFPNWNAQLKYLKFFRFSAPTEIHDEVCFLATSLEAAIQHVQSENLIVDDCPSVGQKEFSDESKCQKNLLSKTYKVQYKTEELGSLSKYFRDISLGNLEQVKLCLEMGRDADDESTYQKLCHPLCTCSKCIALTKKSRDSFPTVNSRDGQGLTPLHIASMYGKSSVVQFLLANGANPNESDFNGMYPIHYAAMRGNQNEVLLMGYAGADVNAVDYSLNTPLHYCCNNGHENCVKALIYFCENSGIKLNINAQDSRGDLPLHKASRWGYLGIVEILLENGADPTVRNKAKLSSIDVAHNAKVTEMLTRPWGEVRNYVRVIPFKPMLDHQEEVGQDARVKQTVRGVVPSSIDQLKKLEKTLKAITDGDDHLTCFYLGLDVSELENEKEDRGKAEEPSPRGERCHPLCRCSECENSSSDDGGEEAGGDRTERMNVNSCNAEGYTPLHISAVHGHSELCRLLVRNGALVNAQTRERLLTPLMLACQNRRLGVVSVLLKAGSNVDMQDVEGNTALHYACRARDVKVVEAIVECEPDLNLKNNRKKTALQEAKENMFIGVMKAIRKGSSFGLLDGLTSQNSDE